MSRLQFLTTASLPTFADGALAAAVDAKIAEIYADLKSRPRLPKKRKLTVVLDFEPNPMSDEANVLKEVISGFEVKASIPNLGPVHVMLKPEPDGLTFRPEVPENPDQMHIMDEVDRKHGKRD